MNIETKSKIELLKNTLREYPGAILVVILMISLIFGRIPSFETDQEKADRLAKESRIVSYDLLREKLKAEGETEKQRITSCIDELENGKGQDKQPVSCLSIPKIIVKATTGTGTATKIAEPKRTLKPDELFYTTAVSDKCAISQTEKQHFKSNGRLATDVACSFGKSVLYAPDYKNKVYKYTVQHVNYKDTGDSLILRFEAEGKKMFWLIGHINASAKFQSSDETINAKVTTGEVIGEMNDSGITTGYHSHVELWLGTELKGGTPIPYSSSTNALINYRLEEMKTWSKDSKFFFTHYDLGDVKQNDASPCIGASGKDLCELQKKGVDTIALTKDVQKSFGISYGDKIQLEGPCAGIYQVEDTMNSRYTYGCAEREGACIKGDISKDCSGIHTIKKV